MSKSSMPGRREIIWAERHEVSSLCMAGVMCYQGRQPYMEDRFSVITNINGSEISLYSVFDGHAGEFAAEFAAEVIMPEISEKIGNILELVRLRNEKIALAKAREAAKAKAAAIAKLKTNRKSLPAVEEVKVDEESEQTEEDPLETDPLNEYITSENIINFEKLLHDEILRFDSVLLDRMAKVALFCGTTANIVLVDLTNKLIVCANVGDSRAVMCDSKGTAFPLSMDHKPNNADEMTRIRENGGCIKNISGCWRVEGSLACSRSLGDLPLKQKKVIIADPDIKTFKFKDFKNLPKFIIVGTDGLFDVFGNQEVCDYTKQKLKEHHFGARALMKKAYARKSSDNITAIVIKFIKPKPKKAVKPSFDLTSNTYEWLK